MFEENKIKEYDDRHRQKVAELGIGTNITAWRTDNILECEKILGTVHIAAGDNTSYYGGRNKSDVHGDFVIPGIDVVLDGEFYLLKKGKLMIE